MTFRKLALLSSTALILAGCSSFNGTGMLLKAVESTSEHQAFVKDPQSLNGKFFKFSPTANAVGSTTFENAIEAQRVDQMDHEGAVKVYSQQDQFTRFKAGNVLINEGMNRRMRRQI